MTRSLRLAVALTVLLVAGCARTGQTVEGEPTPVFGPDELVVQAASFGGFTGNASFANVPMVSVYGDGRVITVGQQIDIYPPPALPNVQVTTISRADVGRLWRMALTAGVDRPQDYGQPQIADATSTRFRVRTSAGLQTTEVYALREAPTLTPARAALISLLDALQDLRKTLGAGAVPAEQAYQAKAVAALSRDWSADPMGPQKEVAWPGPALPGPAISGAFGCVTAEGDAARAVLDAAARANAITPWTSGGKRWLVQLRPLLPDEVACASLIH